MCIYLYMIHTSSQISIIRFIEYFVPHCTWFCLHLLQQPTITITITITIIIIIINNICISTMKRILAQERVALQV